MNGGGEDNPAAADRHRRPVSGRRGVAGRRGSADVEGGRVFDLHRLQVVGVQAEQGQDGGCDLGGLDLLRAGPVVADRVAGDDQRDVAGLRVRAAVFGDLAGAAGVDDADLGDAEQVGDPGIAGLDVEVGGGVEAARMSVRPNRV